MTMKGFTLRAVRQRVERLAGETTRRFGEPDEELLAILDEGRQRNARGEHPPEMTREESLQRGRELRQLMRDAGYCR
jgi:hypothetical protein